MLSSEDHVRVDVTMSEDGLRKAQQFHSTVHKRPVVFGATVILTTWARVVGLIRSLKGERMLPHSIPKLNVYPIPNLKVRLIAASITSKCGSSPHL